MNVSQTLYSHSGGMDIDCTDCDNTTVTYNIPGTTQTGNFTMTLVLDSNVELCEALSN